MANSRAWVPHITFGLKSGLYTRLREGALSKDVSLVVWVKAILMEHSMPKEYGSLTHQAKEEIKKAVRGA